MRAILERRASRTHEITQVANIEKMGRHKRYDAPQQQECKEAQVVSGGHVDGSKQSRPELPETITRKRSSGPTS